MTTINRRGMYHYPIHDRQADWRFLEQWQPSVYRLMLDGSHTDPNSVDINRIVRAAKIAPQTRLLLRVWDVDDRNGEAKQAMVADPIEAAQAYHDWWYRLFQRIPHDVRGRCIAGSINEPLPQQFEPLHPFTQLLCRLGHEDDVRYGVLCFSTGTPALPEENQPYGWQYFADLEDDILAGQHYIILHEYMQPEGMYGTWVDQEGRTRSDYGYLIGRHKHCPMKRAPIIIGEWGIEGLLYNRHRDPVYGHAGWRNFPDLWGPERYADEYLACVRDAAPNVIAICPFISDYGDKTWQSADVMPAYGALLSRRHLCEVEVSAQDTHNAYVPHVRTPSAEPVQPQPKPEPPMNPKGSAIDPLVLEAIVSIESGGRAFGESGKPIIRFEAHIFAGRTQSSQAQQLFRFNAERPWTQQQIFTNGQWRELHTGAQSVEYLALGMAAALDPDAAYESISVGLAQIMGFNHARIGYPSAEAMYMAFARSETAQVIGLLNFVLSDSALTDAVRRKDWRTIAALYNGSGAVDTYAPLLEAEYKRLQRA